ncbi:MAG: purine-nucleoside phosphorylase [Planctomycetes bacterium]|nr:purine-nucleoside phosphorylase [Planctomycetota bacterium]
MQPTQDMIATSVAAIRAKAPKAAPKIGIIFGTGLSSLRKDFTNTLTIPYAQIPHFVRSTVESHPGELLFGKLEGHSVVAMRGRFHAYEGYSFDEVTYPVRVMKALGVEILIVSNACGLMNPQWSVGEVMLIEDHINLMGGNPLVGRNNDTLGPRFPDMSAPYDAKLMALALRAAADEKIRLEKGVYVAVLGPNLETRAEYRMLRAMGADVVGMSTVPEVVVAIHAGMRVLGFSVMTDACFPDALQATALSDILARAASAEPKMNSIVRGVLRRLKAAKR